MAGRLELGEDPGGPRHFLDGEPVHAGTELEVMLEDERWFPLRFETSNHEPVFFFPVKGAAEQAKVKLPQAAILRWPGS